MRSICHLDEVCALEAILLSKASLRVQMRPDNQRGLTEARGDALRPFLIRTCKQGPVLWL